MNKFPKYEIISNKTRSRIWLFYNPATVVINNIVLHEQLIHCTVTSKATNLCVATTFVYGMNDPQDRHRLWGKLISISLLASPWLVTGDFNVVRDLTERKGPNPPSLHDIMDFNACLAQCLLDDMNCTGAEFSWTNKHEHQTRTWARLDRLLINPDWTSLFPAYVAECLPPEISDHAPLLVSFGGGQKFTKNFSFLNAWTMNPDYHTIVATAWASPCYSTPTYQLYFKLRMVKKAFTALHKQSYSDIVARLKDVQKDLETCQMNLQNDLFSPTLIALERDLICKYKELSTAENDMLFQRAKTANIRKGDSSSSYFFCKNCHTKTSKHYWINYGQGRECQEGLMRLSLALDPGSLQLLVTFLPPLSLALKSRVPSTALAPQKARVKTGFLLRFFKTDWELVGDLFCTAIEEFFRKGKMMRKVNTTLLALIPKKSVPSMVQDFRPIACCSVVYKTISKIIANRLKCVLPDLIGNEQAAFVQGRNIFENIMMTQNLIKNYNQSTTTPRCLIKVDIRKAFDSIQWVFISNMLTGLHFPATFIKWAMGCITSTWFTLKINGSQCGFFPGKSGVRQGDPISPYIFVLGMELLSRHLRRIHHLHRVSYHPKCAKLNLNHLIFADDLMIFMRGDTPSVVAAAQCLVSFASISGLYASPTKTSIYYGGVHDEVKRQIQALTGYTEDNFPFRYLSITMNPGRLSPSMFNIMIDKIQGSSPLVWQSPFLCPEASAHQRGHFWLGKLLRRMTFKGWSSICKPWLEGGYNVKELLSWNKALLSKWVWHLTQNRDGIWDRWNRTYNYRDHTIWEAQSRSWHAESWRDIIKTKNFLLEIAGSSANAQRMLNACVTHGQFSVGKAYHFFRDKGHSTRWVAALTAPSIMPKHLLCTIQAGQRQLPTVDNLSKRGDAYDIKDCLYKLLGGNKQRKWRNDAAASCVAGMVYEIWNARNTRIFGGAAKTPAQIATTLQQMLKLRFSDNSDRRMQNWLATRT
ncbi:uncharacterized protein LOC141607999 [Silene latifolia]|uniref:uncharacterized protein LOC141607999 n=1 Tax=Silene latifolia TaxID=37657 RepID=UPI003D77E027